MTEITGNIPFPKEEKGRMSRRAFLKAMMASLTTLFLRKDTGSENAVLPHTSTDPFVQELLDAFREGIQKNKSNDTQGHSRPSSTLAEAPTSTPTKKPEPTSVSTPTSKVAQTSERTSTSTAQPTEMQTPTPDLSTVERRIAEVQKSMISEPQVSKYLDGSIQLIRPNWRYAPNCIMDFCDSKNERLRVIDRSSNGAAFRGDEWLLVQAIIRILPWIQIPTEIQLVRDKELHGPYARTDYSFAQNKDGTWRNVAIFHLSDGWHLKTQFIQFTRSNDLTFHQMIVAAFLHEFSAHIMGYTHDDVGKRIPSTHVKQFSAELYGNPPSFQSKKENDPTMYVHGFTQDIHDHIQEDFGDSFALFVTNSSILRTNAPLHFDFFYNHPDLKKYQDISQLIISLARLTESNRSIYD